MNIINNIKKTYATLGRVQKHIADYVMDNPEKVCFLSIRELAKELGTTEVTVFRFLSKIGFTSYNEFKKELQTQIRNWISPNEQMQQAISHVSDNDLGSVFRKVAQSETKTVKHTYSVSNIEAFQNAVNMIAGAGKVFVIGHEISESIAKFCEFRLNQLNKRAEYLNVYQLESVAHCIANLEKDTIFIIISFPIYSEGTLALINYLTQNDIKYISISDRHSSDIAVNAAVSLVCDNNDVIFYNSITSAISLVNMICSLFAVTIQTSSDNYKERVDQILHDLKVALYNLPET